MSRSASADIGGSAGPGLLVVVQGSAGIQESVADPAVLGEEGRDVVAGLPGPADVSASFVVPKDRAQRRG